MIPPMKALLLFWFAIGMLPLHAGLKFEEESISAKASLEDKTISSDYKFTNTGDSPLTIKSADAGCSCISVEVAGGKLTYAPGEAGVLRANFEIGSFQGTVEKAVYVWLEGDPEEKPSSTLKLSVTIPTIIALEPKTVKWTLGEEALPKVIEVKMDYEKPIHITQVNSNNENFKSELITLEAGKHYQIKVTPVDGESAGLAIMRIETDVDVPTQKTQQAFAVISAPLKKLP